MQITHTLIALLSALATVDAYVVKDSRSEYKTTKSKPIGGPHGDIFDDVHQIGKNHRRMSAISMSGGCQDSEIGRVTQLQMTFRDNQHESDTVSVNHGKHHGNANARGILLNLDEYVTKVEIATYKADVGKFGFSSWTRIGYIKFTTNQSKTLECGAIFGDEKKIAVEDGALLYFSGKQGDMLDSLTAHWIPTAAF